MYLQLSFQRYRNKVGLYSFVHIELKDSSTEYLQLIKTYVFQWSPFTKKGLSWNLMGDSAWLEDSAESNGVPIKGWALAIPSNFT